MDSDTWRASDIHVGDIVVKTGLWGRPGTLYRVTRIDTYYPGKARLWGNPELKRGGFGRGEVFLGTDWDLVL